MGGCLHTHASAEMQTRIQTRARARTRTHADEEIFKDSPSEVKKTLAGIVSERPTKITLTCDDVRVTLTCDGDRVTNQGKRKREECEEGEEQQKVVRFSDQDDTRPIETRSCIRGLLKGDNTKDSFVEFEKYFQTFLSLIAEYTQKVNDDISDIKSVNMLKKLLEKFDVVNQYPDKVRKLFFPIENRRMYSRKHVRDWLKKMSPKKSCLKDGSVPLDGTFLEREDSYNTFYNKRSILQLDIPFLDETQLVLDPVDCDGFPINPLEQSFSE